MTWSSQFFNGSLCDVRHKAHNGKYDDPSKHTGAGVYTAHNDRISKWKTKKSEKNGTAQTERNFREKATSDCMTSTHHMYIMSEHLDRD